MPTDHPPSIDEGIEAAKADRDYRIEDALSIHTRLGIVMAYIERDEKGKPVRKYVSGWC